MKIGRILLVSYDYPPLPTPQSLRWGYLSRELIRREWTVDVLTIHLPERYQFLHNIPPAQIRIFRTFSGLFFHFVYKYSTATCDMSSRKDKQSFQWLKSALRNIFKILRRVFQKVLDYFLIPDARIEWLPFALLKGYRLISKNKYDLLISSSEPPVSHLVGFILQKVSGLPWVADYGDPWLYPVSTVSTSHWKSFIEGKIEEYLLRKVHGITVTTEQFKQYYLDKYCFLKSDNIKVVPQGFDPDEYNRPNPKYEKNIFRIIYTGSFHKNIRDPYIFMQGLSKLKHLRIQMIIAGFMNHEHTNYFRRLEKDELDPVLCYMGPVGHDEAVDLQKNATILLLIDNAGGVQVPGKIFEYLAARRPILVVQSSENSPTSELVIREKRGIITKNKTGDIQDAIQKLYRWWEEGTLEQHFDLITVPSYSWQNNAQIIDEWLRSVVVSNRCG